MAVNHLLFAYEICVFDPSISGLEHRLNISYDYATGTKILFNSNKEVSVFSLLKVKTTCNTSCIPEWRKFEVCGPS